MHPADRITKKLDLAVAQIVPRTLALIRGYVRTANLVGQFWYTLAGRITDSKIGTDEDRAVQRAGAAYQIISTTISPPRAIKLIENRVMRTRLVIHT